MQQSLTSQESTLFNCCSLSACSKSDQDTFSIKNRIQEIHSNEFQQSIYSRSSIRAPKYKEVSKMITFILLKLRISARTSKSAVILMLMLLEKIIVKSQNMRLKNFNCASVSEVQELIGDLFDSVADLRGTHQQIMNTNASYELMDMKPACPLFQVHPVNWKPLVYISLLESIKFLEDNLFWNAEVVAKLKLFDLAATNRYEHLFLSLIEFELAPDPQ